LGEKTVDAWETTIDYEALDNQDPSLAMARMYFMGDRATMERAVINDGWHPLQETVALTVCTNRMTAGVHRHLSSTTRPPLHCPRYRMLVQPGLPSEHVKNMPLWMQAHGRLHGSRIPARMDPRMTRTTHLLQVLQDLAQHTVHWCSRHQPSLEPVCVTVTDSFAWATHFVYLGGFRFERDIWAEAAWALDNHPTDEEEGTYRYRSRDYLFQQEEPRIELNRVWLGNLLDLIPMEEP